MTLLKAKCFEIVSLKRGGAKEKNGVRSLDGNERCI